MRAQAFIVFALELHGFVGELLLGGAPLIGIGTLLRYKRCELRSFCSELFDERGGLRIATRRGAMPRECEAPESQRLLPQNEIVHSGGQSGIALAIGIGEAVGLGEELVYRIEKRPAILVAHGRQRLRELGAQRSSRR